MTPWALAYSRSRLHSLPGRYTSRVLPLLVTTAFPALTASTVKNFNLGAVDKETLVDASGFVFDNSLPMEKRAARMLEQLKNPYCFRYGDMAIKLEFAEDGLSLQELLTAFFLRQKSGL